MPDLKGKTLFISGASRGIGLAIALRAARDGANIVVAAKTAQPDPRLPGTVYTAASAIEQAGGKASNGYARILELEVKELHQRSAIFIGSENMVKKAEEMMSCFSPQVMKKSFEGVVRIQ